MSAADLVNTLTAALIWSGQLYLYERSLEPAPADPQPPPPPGVTCTLIGPENVAWVRDWLDPGAVRCFQRLLNQGDMGIYALAGGEVIHYQWAALKLPGHTWAHAHDPIEMGDALLHRGYTREDHRRRGVSAYAVTYCLARLREQYRERGLRRVCVIVRADNPIPQRLFASLGFSKTQRFTLIRLLGTCFIYWSRDILPDAAGAPAPGRLQVRFKVPEILWNLGGSRGRTRPGRDQGA